MNSKDIIKRNDEILDNAMNFALCKTEMCYNDIAFLASHYKMKFPKYMDYLIKAYSPYRFCAAGKHDKISNFLIKLRNKILKEELKWDLKKEQMTMKEELTDKQENIQVDIMQKKIEKIMK